MGPLRWTAALIVLLALCPVAAASDVPATGTWRVKADWDPAPPAAGEAGVVRVEFHSTEPAPNGIVIRITASTIDCGEGAQPLALAQQGTVFTASYAPPVGTCALHLVGTLNSDAKFDVRPSLAAVDEDLSWYPPVQVAIAAVEAVVVAALVVVRPSAWRTPEGRLDLLCNRSLVLGATLHLALGAEALALGLAADAEDALLGGLLLVAAGVIQLVAVRLAFRREAAAADEAKATGAT